MDSITQYGYAATMLFGAHMPTGGGVWKALERGASIGCDIVQIFVKNNMQWLGRPYTPAELETFEGARAACPVAALFAHAGYLINLAAPACKAAPATACYS